RAGDDIDLVDVPREGGERPDGLSDRSRGRTRAQRRGHGARVPRLVFIHFGRSLRETYVHQAAFLDLLEYGIFHGVVDRDAASASTLLHVRLVGLVPTVEDDEAVADVRVRLR